MLEVGGVFAGYTIERQLGAGGMGEVYLARHPRLPRRDALKILRPEQSTDPDFRARFIREADLAATLTHPHIVTVHDRGEHNGQLWIATAYIDGTDAAHLLRERYPVGMPADEATTITTAIAGALDYAHARGLLHRDVKPANILLSHPDHTGQRQIYLADFGIARPLADANGLTATNTTLGTFNYAAPEQLTGDTLDGRADQYALAASTYQLLTGTTPFTSATNPIAVISQHLNTPPPPVSRHRPDLTTLDSILAKALAKSPADRYTTCAAFATALTEQKPFPSADNWTAAAMTAAAATPPPMPVPETLQPGTAAPEPERTRRNPKPMLWAGLAGSVVAVAGAALLWAQQRDPVATTPPVSAPPAATITATPPPETVTKTIAPNPPQPTNAELNLPPDQGGAVLFQTPSGRTACDVRANTVWCGVDFTIATPTLYGSCPANGISLRPDGSWEWVCGDIGGNRIFRPLTYGIPYRAIDWRIMVTTEGTTFTNLMTGRGITVSAEGMRAP